MNNGRGLLGRPQSGRDAAAADLRTTVQSMSSRRESTMMRLRQRRATAPASPVDEPYNRPPADRGRIVSHPSIRPPPPPPRSRNYRPQSVSFRFTVFDRPAGSSSSAREDGRSAGRRRRVVNIISLAVDDRPRTTKPDRKRRGTLLSRRAGGRRIS